MTSTFQFYLPIHLEKHCSRTWYGVYLFQLIRHSRTCASYLAILDRWLLPTSKPFTQTLNNGPIDRWSLHNVGLSDDPAPVWAIIIYFRPYFSTFRTLTICRYGTVLTTILPILFLYLNTVIVTAGAFEPQWEREVWRFKIWFNPPFL